MKRIYTILLALVMTLVMMMCMTACGGKTGGEDAAASADTEAADTQGEAEQADARTVVKTIEGVDEELEGREPLMIDSITLYDDGTVAVVPLDELKKNEAKGDEEAVYPFEESGKATDVHVVDYGDEGYRTIIALMDDGTISAVNGRALVEDHIFAVLDTVAGRDNFVRIEAGAGEDGETVAYTDDNEEIVLDYSLNFDDPEQEN